jgi:plastocyanin
MTNHMTGRGRRPAMARRAVAVCALGAMSLLAACGDDDDSPSTGNSVQASIDEFTTDAPDPGEGAVVDTGNPADSGVPTEEGTPAGGVLTIQGLTYSPLTVTAGAEFSIENLDGFEHTVTSDSFDVRVDGGATETLTIAEPGTYDIHCEIHSGMQGTIVVN